MVYEYQVQNDQEVVFESDSKLECEMVAIALAFTSLYIGENTFEVAKGKKVIDEVDPQSSVQRMREKIENAKFNKRIPERIEDEEIDKFIAYQLRKNQTNVGLIIDKVIAIEALNRKLEKL